MPATLGNLLFDIATFASTYTVLNYLLPNNNISFFIKAFLGTSGMLVSGVVTDTMYKKFTGKSKSIFSAWRVPGNKAIYDCDLVLEETIPTELGNEYI